MSLESELIAALNPLVNNRVHLGLIPVDNEAWPAICLPVEIITPDNTICGASDLEDYRVQIDAYAKSSKAVIALRGEILAAVELAFPLATRINSLADYDPDLKLFRRIIEYSIPAE